MHTQQGGPPKSGIGLGLGIGLAVGVGGVMTFAGVAVVAMIVFRGPARTRASLPVTPAAPATVGQHTASLQPAPPAAAQPAGAPKPAALSADTLYTRTAPAVVRIEVRDDRFRGVSQGTGFFVSADGLLVTNYHVIDGGAFATLETADGSTLFVEGVVAVDKVQDLALLKVKTGGARCLELGPDERPPVGTRVFAIGHPRGVRHSTLSEGLVSSIGVALGGDVASIQTTAPVSPGSSGGPLITADGKVVGVIAAQRDDAQNLNFAVPVSLVLDLLLKGRSAPLKPLASAGGASLDREQAAVLRKAMQAIDRRDLREASSILAEAKSKLAASHTYWSIYGGLQMELANYAAASDAYQHAVKVKPDAVESHAMLAVSYVFQEKHREALRAFEAASKLAPRDPKYYAAAGRCYMEMKQPDRAVSFYKKAIQLAPSDAAYVARLGDAYYEMQQYADAMMAYEKSLKINPGSADAQVSLAQCYIQLRRDADAAEPLRKALALNPNHAGAHLHTGLLQLSRGQVTAAMVSFQTAAKLDPGGKVGQTALGAMMMVNSQLEQEQQRIQQERARQQAQQQQQLPRAPPGRR
jgi:S1-C subfamily serine protease/Flp pilus assembly protein TadD